MTRCSKCKTNKPSEAFSKDTERPRGLQSWCKVCAAEHKIFKLYDLTVDEWYDLWNSHGSACAACGNPADGPTPHLQRYWHVDHNHNTGKVRGILCHHCNLTIGNAKESPERLVRCAEYVILHNGEPTDIAAP